MFLTELFVIVVIVLAIYLYRNYKGDNVGKYIFESDSNLKHELYFWLLNSVLNEKPFIKFKFKQINNKYNIN